GLDGAGPVYDPGQLHGPVGFLPAAGRVPAPPDRRNGPGLGNQVRVPDPHRAASRTAKTRRRADSRKASPAIVGRWSKGISDDGESSVPADAPPPALFFDRLSRHAMRTSVGPVPPRVAGAGSPR